MKAENQTKPTRSQRVYSALDRLDRKATGIIAQQRANRLLEKMSQAALVQSGHRRIDAELDVYAQRKGDPEAFSRRANDLADYRARLSEGEFGIPRHVVSHSMFVSPGEVLEHSAKWAEVRDQHAGAVAGSGEHPIDSSVVVPVTTAH